MHRIIVTGAKGKLSCKTADRLSAKPDISVTQLSLRGDWQNYDFSDTFGIVHIAGVTPQNAKSEEDYEKINYELTKELATLAKQLNLDAVHDTVHEMCKDEARHGRGFKGLLDRYFGK